MNKLAKISLISLATATLIANSSFATLKECVGEGSKFPGLSLTHSEEYPVKCTRVKDETGRYQTIYGKSTADCARSGTIAADIEAACGETIAPDNSSNDSSLDLYSALFGLTTGDGNNNTQKTTEQKKESPVLLIISLAANGVLAIAVIVLIIVLANKGKSGSVQANIAAQTPTMNTAQPAAPAPATPTAEPIPQQEPETPQNATTIQ